MQNTKDDTIVFRPVAGYTINRAIAESIDLATKKNKSVKLDINDIVLDITAQSELLKVKDLYLRLLNEKYAKTK